MSIKKLIAPPLSIAGMSVGLGLLGDALGSTSMSSAGATAEKFISPAVTLSASGIVIKQLKGLK